MKLTLEFASSSSPCHFTSLSQTTDDTGKRDSLIENESWKELELFNNQATIVKVGRRSMLPHLFIHSRPTTKHMATNANFHSFHSMRADPFTAVKCIKSFTAHDGCILFMPYTYNQSANKSGIMEEINLYDASDTLNWISYYALVIVSFTGLSTILGLTQTVKAVEFATGQAPTVWPLDQSNRNRIAFLRSDLEPKIKFKDEIFEYIQMHLGNDNGNTHTTIKLKRQYEYFFRLVGLNVVMLHFTSNKSSSTPGENREVLHLVEVYRIQNPHLRAIMTTMFSSLGKLSRGLFGRKDTVAKKKS